MTLSPELSEQIRYFIAAADAGQVSHAGMQLNVSQSAVTAAMKQLEDELGVPCSQRHAAACR